MIIDNRVKQGTATTGTEAAITLVGNQTTEFMDFVAVHTPYMIFTCIVKEGNAWQIILAEMDENGLLQRRHVKFDSGGSVDGQAFLNLSGSAEFYQDIIVQSSVLTTPENSGRLGFVFPGQSNQITGAGALKTDGFSTQIKQMVYRNSLSDGVTNLGSIAAGAPESLEYGSFDAIGWPIYNIYGVSPDNELTGKPAEFVSWGPYYIEKMIRKYQIQEECICITASLSGSTFGYFGGGDGDIDNGWGLQDDSDRNPAYEQFLIVCQLFLSENPLNRIMCFNWLQGVTEMLIDRNDPLSPIGTNPEWSEGFQLQLKDFRMEDLTPHPSAPISMLDSVPGNFLQTSADADSWLQYTPWITSTTTASVAEGSPAGADVHRDIIKAGTINKRVWAATNLANTLTSEREGIDSEGNLLFGTEFVHIPSSQFRELIPQAAIESFDHARFNDLSASLRPLKLNNVKFCPGDGEVIVIPDEGIVSETGGPSKYETQWRVRNASTPFAPFADESTNLVAHTGTLEGATLAPVRTNKLAFAVTGLTNDVRYDIRIRVVSSVAGPSDWVTRYDISPEVIDYAGRCSWDEGTKVLGAGNLVDEWPVVEPASNPDFNYLRSWGFLGGDGGVEIQTGANAGAVVISGAQNSALIHLISPGNNWIPPEKLTTIIVFAPENLSAGVLYSEYKTSDGSSRNRVVKAKRANAPDSTPGGSNYADKSGYGYLESTSQSVDDVDQPFADDGAWGDNRSADDFDINDVKLQWVAGVRNPSINFGRVLFGRGNTVQHIGSTVSSSFDTSAKGWGLIGADAGFPDTSNQAEATIYHVIQVNGTLSNDQILGIVAGLSVPDQVTF